MNDNRVLIRIIASYVLALGAFWLAFLLNRSYHWLSVRHFLAITIGIGSAMCLGALAAAVMTRRTSR